MTPSFSQVQLFSDSEFSTCNSFSKSRANLFLFFLPHGLSRIFDVYWSVTDQHTNALVNGAFCDNCCLQIANYVCAFSSEGRNLSRLFLHGQGCLVFLGL